jgi:hypothetical protein
MTSLTSTAFPPWSTLLEEQADPADDLRRARSIPRESPGGLACLFEIREVTRQPAQAGIGIRDGGGNGLIDLVRQGGG